MSLRVKLVIALASLAGLSAMSIGVATYRAMSIQLNEEVDQSLRDAIANAEVAVEALSDATLPRVRRNEVDLRERLRSDDDLRVTLLHRGNNLAISTALEPLPFTAGDWAMTEQPPDASEWWRDVAIDGERFRVATAPLPDQFAVQVARRLDEVDRVLATIRNRALASVALVVVLATLAGWLIARQATVRLLALTRTAGEVATTGRLDVDPPPEGTDEVGRLGGAFASMLAALRRSRDAQTQLVQDASHELRTPLTSLRTNISLLRRIDELPDDVRQQVVDDLDSEARELSTLVDELVELATDRRTDEPESELGLVPIARRVAERAARRTGRDVTVEVIDEGVVRGRPGAIERALSNLVDNALKFSDDDAPVEVRVDGGTVEVLDRGIGIAPDDLPHVFDRFYRSVDARSRPGSGLGLAIVHAVAESHGGAAEAGPREGGGTRMALVLPTDAVPTDSRRATLHG
ncbi:MAG: HAMP domain-containing histidine kinase [Acidimicrobiia bacterium]|nr:HAMP domain-containing histidine kinase [Acidimicrobiia bacterium]